jgi:hypothetical protein
MVVALTALALVAAAAAAAVVATRGDGADRVGAAPPNSVAVIDATTNKVVGRIAVGMLPDAVVAGAGAVWALNGGEQTVSRIARDPPHVISVTAVGTLSRGFTALAWGFDRAWIADPGFGRVFPIYPDGNREPAVRVLRPRHGDVLSLAVGDHALWVGSAKASAVFALDPVTHHVLARAPVRLDVVGIAFGAGALWVAGIDAGGSSSTSATPSGGSIRAPAPSRARSSSAPAPSASRSAAARSGLQMRAGRASRASTRARIASSPQSRCRPRPAPSPSSPVASGWPAPSRLR